MNGTCCSSTPPQMNMEKDLYVVHQGFLTKRGKNVKNWKRRWFVLKSNGSMSYHKLQVAPEEHTELPRAAGVFVVDTACTILPREELKVAIDWGDAAPNTGLCIRTEARDFYLTASNASERKIWMQRLRSVRDLTRRKLGAGKNNVSFRSTASDDHIQTTSGQNRPTQRPTSYSDASQNPRRSRVLGGRDHADDGSDAVRHARHRVASQLTDTSDDDGDCTEAIGMDMREDADHGGGVVHTVSHDFTTPATSQQEVLPLGGGFNLSAIDDEDDDDDGQDNAANHEYVNVCVATDATGLSHFALRDSLPTEEEAKLRQQQNP
ncbi:hypothetical protein PTSG_01218 [Salpingoeca rosetta]|uniref:PH domain-containing protein n=1 Tax=Salpingoeca rosetta (strain ATCC 50818 / BSB-021) TaxID=946362 RepID=F2U156_SALR5|nr:uncharacterized protein PTSG_01218 [Salpingoeca rosetta]EGD80630.1 hypothetical protein PTSG_01218 [Salpingoeca rosetta]|eukprot:XP_004997191.1 hypothetical protein PTSG_01218 [Salpingoeca rosetta]